jgi:plastocyanin
MRFGLALVLGLLAALLVVQFPASAADTAISAEDPPNWSNENVTIDVNDKVTWTNGTGFSHNVCIRRENVSSGCGEFQSPPAPSATWPSDVSHQFTSDGTFTFYCQAHPTQMRGTIKVGTGDNPPVDTGTGTGTSTATGTGTSTVPPPDTQPTDTITVPTQTQTTTTTAADTAAPAFTGKVKRRSSRKALIVELRSSEDATLKARVFRRPPRGRSFGRIGQTSLHVNQGKNVLTLVRLAKRRRSGAFRVKLQLVDAAGNKSATKTLSFKLA